MHIRQDFEALDKLCHDAKHSPRIVLREFIHNELLLVHILVLSEVPALENSVDFSKAIQ
jgi:hypothetical protein